MAEDKTQLELSRDEALVLFDWITRFNNRDEETSFEDQAEQRVLWNLEAMLEQVLVEPFDSNYEAILAKARAKVRDSQE